MLMPIYLSDERIMRYRYGDIGIYLSYLRLDTIDNVSAQCVQVRYSR